MIREIDSELPEELDTPRTGEGIFRSHYRYQCQVAAVNVVAKMVLVRLEAEAVVFIDASGASSSPKCFRSRQKQSR